MASAWGDAWGGAWGDAWGAIVVVPATTPIAAVRVRLAHAASSVRLRTGSIAVEVREAQASVAALQKHEADVEVAHGRPSVTVFAPKKV